MSGATCVICEDEIDEVRVRNASDEPVHSDCLTDALELQRRQNEQRDETSLMDALEEDDSDG